ncbi:MAG: hypothetical protein LBJ63_00120, partial [Prevotellaceae bacterium]|nr:hypothetical protein [Prevotellaceae bacterium]
LEDNIEVLYSDINHYKVNDSLNAAGINRLYMSKTELERYNADLAKQIEDLNIKLKRVRSVTSTNVETRYNIVTNVIDSVVYHYADSSMRMIDTLQCIKFRNAYIDIDGCIAADTFAGKITDKIELTHIVHRVPKRFLFFRFGCKAVRLEALSTNPYADIKHVEYIEVK